MSIPNIILLLTNLLLFFIFLLKFLIILRFMLLIARNQINLMISLLLLSTSHRMLVCRFNEHVSLNFMISGNPPILKWQWCRVGITIKKCLASSFANGRPELYSVMMVFFLLLTRREDHLICSVWLKHPKQPFRQFLGCFCNGIVDSIKLF